LHFGLYKYNLCVVKRHSVLFCKDVINYIILIAVFKWDLEMLPHSYCQEHFNRWLQLKSCTVPKVNGSSCLAEVVLYNKIVWFQVGRKAGLSDGEIESYLKQIKGDAVKEKLRQTTQEAIDLGVRDLTVLTLFVTYYYP